jgi:hypothetical protein
MWCNVLPVKGNGEESKISIDLVGKMMKRLLNGIGQSLAEAFFRKPNPANQR